MSTHEIFLDRLVGRIREIGERPQDIEWIIKEGIWYRPNHDYITMPDIIACCKDQRFLIAELKGSKYKREKARSQVNSGELFVKEHFPYRTIIKKFVVYQERKNSYYWEIVN